MLSLLKLSLFRGFSSGVTIVFSFLVAEVKIMSFYSSEVCAVSGYFESGVSCNWNIKLDLCHPD